jgi:hypothetical protein
LRMRAIIRVASFSCLGFHAIVMRMIKNCTSKQRLVSTNRATCQPLDSKTGRFHVTGV